MILTLRLPFTATSSVYFADPDGHSIEYIAVLDQPPDAGFGVASWSDWFARQMD
ncbi:MAG: hypothetical protein QNL16_04425 [Rhodobacterales bacterium]